MKRARVWLGLLLLLLLLALGWGRLRFDAEILNLLPANLPVVQGLKLHQNNFFNARELLITVSAPDADQTETAARNFALALRAQTNLAAAVHWQPPWLEQPAQSAELIAWLWFNQPPEFFGALTNQLAATNLPHLLAESREALATSLSPADIARRSYDPFNLTQLPASLSGSAPSFGDGQETFASSDGTFRVMFVQATSDLAGYKSCIAWHPTSRTPRARHSPL